MEWQPACLVSAMRRQILSSLLAVVLLTSGCFGQPQPSSAGPIEEQIRGIPPDSPVEIHLLDGSKLRGWITQVSDVGFVLIREQENRLEKNEIRFQQVQVLKRVKSVKPSHTTRNIVAGVAIGVVVVVGGLLAAFLGGVR